MNPTLREQDLVEVRPYHGDQRPRLGDVVLLLPPGGDRLIVHRLVQVSSAGFRARGDNNALDDDYALRAEDLIGRVVAAWRGRRRQPIPGGPIGLAQARSLRWLRTLDRRLSRPLHPLYRSLAASGLFRRLPPARFRPRVVHFVVNGQQQLRLISGQRVVGYYDPRRRQWQIRRPYRLMVDELALPGVVPPLTGDDGAPPDRPAAPDDEQKTPVGTSGGQDELFRPGGPVTSPPHSA